MRMPLYTGAHCSKQEELCKINDAYHVWLILLLQLVNWTWRLRCESTCYVLTSLVFPRERTWRSWRRSCLRWKTEVSKITVYKNSAATGVGPRSSWSQIYTTRLITPTCNWLSNGLGLVKLLMYIRFMYIQNSCVKHSGFLLIPTWGTDNLSLHSLSHHTFDISNANTSPH